MFRSNLGVQLPHRIDNERYYGIRPEGLILS